MNSLNQNNLLYFMNYCHILFLFKILDTGVLDHILQDQYFVLICIRAFVARFPSFWVISFLFPYLGHQN
jgi:hypothetical protein